jgi:hypothetical protein
MLAANGLAADVAQHADSAATNEGRTAPTPTIHGTGSQASDWLPRALRNCWYGRILHAAENLQLEYLTTSLSRSSPP